jgi:hypothetical protein
MAVIAISSGSSRTAPGLDLDRFRTDQDATSDTYPDDPYARLTALQGIRDLSGPAA